MYSGGLISVPKRRIEEAKRLRDELDSLIETAEIMNNRRLMKSIRKSERDLKEGKYVKIGSRKGLDGFFKG